MFQGYYMGVSMEGRLEGVSMEFQGIFKNDQRVVQGIFKNVKGSH